MDRSYYQKNRNVRVKMVEKRIPSTSKRLQRSFPPLRGFLARLVDYSSSSRNKQLMSVLDMYHSLQTSVLDFAKSVSRSHYVFEKFQSAQKGPVAPILANSVEDVIIPKLKHEPLVLTDDAKADIDWAFEVLGKHFQYTIDVKHINFADAWKELPSTTVRGFPYLQKGSVVDTQIIREGGTTTTTALNYFGSSSSLICYPGWRLQGKKWPGPAKLRLIFIPDISYQYFMVGVIKPSMNALKHYPSFCGWLTPESRNDRIKTVLEHARDRKMRVLALDYSGFDVNVSPYFRVKCAQFLASKFSDKKVALTFLKYAERKINDQVVCLPKGQLPSFMPVPNQLLSGMINTQHDGCLINLALQLIIARRLGYNLDLDMAMALGDDTGLPVPLSLLEEYGYQGCLERISEIVSNFHFKTHDKKAYPTDQLVYLQKLWDVDKGIENQGSWARSISSFFFMERFHTSIPGVRSISAMDIISQIAIITDAFSNSNMDAFAPTFAKWWLANDRLLRAFCSEAHRNHGDENYLFRLIIRSAVDNVDSLFQYLDIQSYDHKGLAQKLSGGDYMHVFPILSHLMALSNQEPRDTKFSDLLTDLSVGENDEFLLDD